MEKTRFRKNFIWNVIGSTLNSFNSLFYMIIVTRMNGVDVSGVFTLVYSIGNLLTSIGTYAGRTYQVTDKNDVYTDRDYILQRVFSCSLMLIIAAVYCVIQNFDPFRFALTIVIVFLRMFEAAADVLYGIMQKNDELYKSGISLTVKSIFAVTCLILLDVLTDNIVIAFIVISMLWMLVIIFYDIPNTKKYTRGACSWKRSLRLFRTGFFSFAYLFLSAYLANATKYALDGKVSSAAQAAYGIILMPATMINLCALYILQPYINELKNIYLKADTKGFRKSTRFLSVAIIGIGGCALLVAWFLGIPVLNFVYATDLSDYLGCLEVILAGATIMAIITVLSTALTTMRDTKSQFFIYLIVSLLAYFGSPLLVDLYGIEGAAFAYVLCAMIELLLYLVIYFKRYKKWQNELIHTNI